MFWQVEPAPRSIKRAAMMSADLASRAEPALRRQLAASTLDEAIGAACLSLILASSVSLEGSGQTGLSWFSLVGVPVLCAGRAALVLQAPAPDEHGTDILGPVAGQAGAT